MWNLSEKQSHSSFYGCPFYRLRFKLTQALMVTLVKCMNEEDSFHSECARMLTTFLPLLLYGNLLRRSKAAYSAVPGQIGPKFENSFEILWLPSIPYPIKNGGAIVLTRLYINFSNTQGQLTPQSMVESSRNSNSSKRLWLSSLPAKMKIQSKIKELEC